MKEKVMIGLSGGVDSAVAAYILKCQGYDVSGGFMRNWDSMLNNDLKGNPTINDSICPQEVDYLDAKKVSEQLSIPLYRIDFVKEYWDDVFTYFLEEYKKGRTPNPDIFCNKYIKFETFRKFAFSKGFDYIAMGHYAKKVIVDGEVRIYKAKDLNKDQTYFLSQVSLEQFSKALFPLGDITKEEVRKIAHEQNIIVADKKDSTGVCFIGERNFREFLNNYLPAKPGDIIDINTLEKVGSHNGVLYYTLGQRRGLGIGGIKDHESGSYFVVAKDVKKNILYVSQGEENEYLMSDRVIIKNVNYLLKEKNYDFVDGMAKFRYRQKDNPISYRFIDDSTVEIISNIPLKSVTPGQAGVLYDFEGRLLGGGIIEEIYYKGKRKITTHLESNI